MLTAVKVTWTVAFGDNPVIRETLLNMDLNTPGFIVAEMISNAE